MTLNGGDSHPNSTLQSLAPNLEGPEVKRGPDAKKGVSLTPRRGRGSVPEVVVPETAPKSGSSAKKGGGITNFLSRTKVKGFKNGERSASITNLTVSTTSMGNPGAKNGTKTPKARRKFGPFKFNTTKKPKEENSKNGFAKRVKALVTSKSGTAGASSSSPSDVNKGPSSSSFSSTSGRRKSRGGGGGEDQPSFTSYSAVVESAASVASFSSSATSSKSTNNNNSKKQNKKIFKKSRNTVGPGGGAAQETAGGLVTGVDYASSYVRKTGMEPRDPVFALDIRTQNTRLVTGRQRQEIYAMNRVMTRLENDRFKKFCHEKGFKGDIHVEDIFM